MPQFALSQPPLQTWHIEFIQALTSDSSILKPGSVWLPQSGIHQIQFAHTGPASSGGDAAGGGAPGTVRVETRRKAHEASGVWEPWSSYEMEVDISRPPDPVEVSLS